ncbi:thiol-disulfide oxidoreductase DCC family protein, partial [Paenibacillus sp. TAF58]
AMTEHPRTSQALRFLGRNEGNDFNRAAPLLLIFLVNVYASDAKGRRLFVLVALGSWTRCCDIVGRDVITKGGYSMTKITDSQAIVMFDGVCNLCSGAVQFILRNDPKGIFRFASLQSDSGQKLLEQHNLPMDIISTIVLIEGGRSYTRSTAALRIARRLRGAWPLTYAAI